MAKGLAARKLASQHTALCEMNKKVDTKSVFIGAASFTTLLIIEQMVIIYAANMESPLGMHLINAIQYGLLPTTYVFAGYLTLYFAKRDTLLHGSVVGAIDYFVSLIPAGLALTHVSPPPAFQLASFSGLVWYTALAIIGGGIRELQVRMAR